ncbi:MULTISPECIES: acetate--CoA ligase [Halolamina]|uniref:acetate--CoA ligase n=1 Tax=Halolamina pelagica TaxID=699431 RepID=A0A1I5LY46_9EURY|nr:MULTISPECIES: acetate--CoA ligase [Halolamina]NHX35769.1 acetate--CoA ligase [Halolamina sp. R1-12]SFP02314.1 acetyl-CoA synthetase [Halolamina pelagica]
MTGDGADPTRTPATAIDPPSWFREGAAVSDSGIYDSFDRDWPDCWDRAGDLLDWKAEYETVFRGGDAPPFEWFPGGELNASVNCLDRHLPERKNQRALVWEGQLDERRSYTYLELYREVNALAAGLRDLGVEAGDVVTLYLPMVPELPAAMLACARLGAVHNVVFAGFSADALADRMERADSAYLLTCDGYYRRGDAIAQKNKADNARLAVDREVEVVVLDHLGEGVHLGDGYHDYDDLVDAHEGETVDPVPRAAADPLFRIYTSGTTGEPRGVTHTTGGYLAHVAWTAQSVLDIRPEDTHWCAADIGWITGHSYVVYGPLALGATTVLSAGTADHPERDRLWKLIDRHAVDVFYTAPTAIRAFMKWGAEYPERHDLSSLRLLGTVGEPIDQRAWHWYREHIGGGDCPIVDTWWQTETGAILVSTLPGVDAMKPGAAGKPLPGIEAEVVGPTGDPVAPGERGELVVTRPWPGMPVALAEGTDWGEHAVSRRDGWRYHPEDAATVDDDGYVTFLGRADEAVNVAGRRFSTMELESTIVGVPGVAEAAVVGADHEATGSAIYAYVAPEHGVDEATLRERVRDAVEDAVGGVAVPEAVVFTPDLPKTRSGKIMRRLLEDVANGAALGDTSALRNPEIVGELQSRTPDDP